MERERNDSYRYVMQGSTCTDTGALVQNDVILMRPEKKRNMKQDVMVNERHIHKFPDGKCIK